ncbi:probable inactive leucine-rich repeat receptor kinase XIAO [Amborella trichopoda]|uniref:Leucine-rich repeat-containing N-terminal plant-type domain-containing protein n=1 Tax=Amborella trichopoda TaxID=13333 RepID=W1NL51_AMBTC|nr:probable inactive leucine-rich repeat receptor kinase XIAO [Amborella trichopoda]ERM96567.1 hypothetical protein AMTR_s00001p00269630 [Amborella trichopoda]|eukprot:XP_006829151.1 probable inactive leucine-rich repeat receptor kinase XIAO [Amborella trichopoda]
MARSTVLWCALFIVVAECGTLDGDVQGLMQLRDGVESASITPGSCLASWDFTLDPCDSLFGERFTCGFRCEQGRVTEITLDGAGYSGSLAPGVGSLLALKTLDLSNNALSGPLPSSLSKLTSLQRLVLSRNAFSGQIPPAISSLASLEELYLDNNRFQGLISPSLTAFHGLRRLELQNNALSGVLPDMSALPNLYFLDASDNQISGGIAGLPPSLVELSMRNNKLEGDLPENLGDLKWLQVMDLSHNQLSGALPSVLFEHPSLQQLTLSHNAFSQLQVPSNFGASSELIAVDLGYNKIQGLLPVFVTMMPKLSALSLESNCFTGLVPAEYAVKAAAVPGVVRLLLSGNYLYGPIPSSFMILKPDSVTVSLVDNCFMRCPASFFFCQGGAQKTLSACRNFSPAIP